jgi:diguanylate cyclase (GGDEF)-like protein/PAS domain S-box-containing protein
VPVLSNALRRLPDRLSGRRALRALAESEQRYKSLFENNPDAVFSFDLTGLFTSMNAAGHALLGYESVLGESFVPLIVDEDLERVGAHFTAAVGGEAQSYECRVLNAGGELVPLHVTNSPIVVDGAVVGVFGVAKDMTARVAAERRLLVSKQRYKALYQRNPDAVYSLDRSGRFLSGNDACRDLTRYERKDLQGVPFSDLIEPDQREQVEAHLARALSGESVDYECVLVRADHSRAHIRVTKIPIVIDGAVVGVYGMAKDVTEQRRLEDELRRQSRSDALTELPNRTELLERLDRRLRHGEAWLLFVDLDRFKVVNDSLGHAAGDALLRDVVQRLDGVLRRDDLLVRFGGDEFCVVLALGTTGEQAQAVAARLCEAVRPSFQVAGAELYVTASIGITCGVAGEEPDEVLRRADVAMYQAKASGRDRVAVYEAGASEATRSQLSLGSELRRALENDELVLHHQPQLSLAEGRTEVVVGVEALVRWQHPDRGLLFPDAFLPAVEGAGLSVALDRWVVRNALHAAASWGRADIGISVNVSPESLLSPAWTAELDAALTSSGLAPHRLTVEITEGALLAEPDRVRHVLGELRDHGVRVALDDFGTGWSSLAYLERYPVDELKIDRLFVSRMSAGAPAPVVDAVLSLAGALGLQTVAEGVETVEQRDLLTAAGCDTFQGYLVARPLPESELLALLRRPVTVPAPRAAAGAGVGAG